MRRREGLAQYLVRADLMLLFNAVLMVGLLLEPPKPVEVEESKNLGKMFITAAWPDGPNDVDLWPRPPGDKPVGYSRKTGKYSSLERDDLGNKGDPFPLNYEIFTARGIPAGEYIVNLHCYSCDGPTTVSVEIRFGDPDVKLFLTKTVTLAPRQEVTVIRFMLDDKGNVVGEPNHVFAPLRSATK